MNKKVNSAVITPVLAAGSVASPFFVLVNLTQRLCCKTCVSRSPVFNPRYSLVGITMVATGQFIATVHVEGIICYTPCGSDGCCDKAQNVSQDFTIPFTSAATNPVVTITQGTSINAMSAVDCQRCSRLFVSETPLTLTVAAA